MKIIPVIDILSGQAVSAYRGERDSYQPLQSMLCQGSEPAAVLRGFLDFYPFTAVYLADLDALLGRGDNNSVINRLTYSCGWTTGTAAASSIIRITSIPCWVRRPDFPRTVW